LFLQRWSPRAFTAEPIGDGDLFTLFEAARWAPSSYNSQPWRFLFTRRDTEHWPRFLGLLNAFNQSLASHAAALVLVLSKTTLMPTGSDKEVFSRTHSFDAGAAWGYLALEAARLGWAAHGMAGFDVDRSAVELGVPANYRVEAAEAIGRPGPKSML